MTERSWRIPGPLDERSEIELQVAEGERQNEMFPPTRPKNHLKNKIKIKKQYKIQNTKNNITRRGLLSGTAKEE